jgi:CYTH domain-containing protein
MKSEKDDPAIPSWIGREVTEDQRFKNRAIAEGSLGDDWRNAVQD